PSYVFMAGISKCMDFLENGKDTFDEYYRNLEGIYDEAKKLKNISLINDELINKNNVSDFDCSKLIIYSEKLSGREIYDMLRDNYQLMCEMATPYIALAMTSPCDDREGFDRLIAALKEIDENI
ncbi:MAG: amino acid decarboxylase, partial [Lachnospiraceae bacterium]|nr:amino acid decarboxylase [Lachnospiraceae bacterium]